MASCRLLELARRGRAGGGGGALRQVPERRSCLWLNGSSVLRLSGRSLRRTALRVLRDVGTTSDGRSPRMRAAWVLLPPTAPSDLAHVTPLAISSRA